MKFIHSADVHLGASPDAGSAYSEKREKEIWNSFAEVMKVCNEEAVDLLLIAGDLFHRQPLLRELKEVSYLFSTLEKTEVVLIAGNHDYLKKDSYYRTFTWPEHVHMILDEELACVELPQLHTAVYGFSYGSREITDSRYDNAFPQGKQDIEILLAHGGDEKHIPIKRQDLVSLKYDYVALGHIHKPQVLEEHKVIYPGALEPIDKNDVGKHGYILGMITDKGCKTQFVPTASREYVHMDVEVHADMTGHELKNSISEAIEQRGIQNIYKITLVGQRDPEMLFALEEIDPYGNIIEMIDDTKPAYEFQKLQENNQGNLIGRFIASFEDCKEDSVEYQALCEGIEALIETRRG